MKLVLDGQDFTDYASLTFDVTYSPTNDKTEGSQYLENIIFSDKAYEYLVKLFFKDFKREHVCKIVLTSDEGQVYNLRLGFEDVTWSGCTIIANPESQDAIYYDNLKKTLWYGYGFIPKYEAYRIPIASGFTILQVILAIIYWILLPIILILKAIEWLFDTKIPALDDLESAITGCGSYHLGYNVLEVFRFQAANCGLEFKSSILESDPYKNLLFVMCASNNGWDDDQDVLFDPQNAVPYTVLQLLKILEPVFHARTWIEGNILYFEDEWLYEKPAVIILDIEKEGIFQEYKYIVGNAWAYAKMSYATDVLDQDGNQASDLYNTIIEYNSPPQEWQKGSLDVYIKDASPQQYQHDKYSIGIVDDLAKTLKNSDKALRLSNSRASQMKLIIHDGKTPRKKMQVLRRWLYNDVYEYNYPMFFDEFKNKVANLKNLVQFYEKVDPRLSAPIEGSDFEFSPCDWEETVSLLDKYKHRCGFKDIFGEGVADKIVVMHDKKRIKVTRPVYRKFI